MHKEQQKQRLKRRFIRRTMTLRSRRRSQQQLPSFKTVFQEAAGVQISIISLTSQVSVICDLPRPPQKKKKKKKKTRKNSSQAKTRWMCEGPKTPDWVNRLCVKTVGVMHLTGSLYYYPFHYSLFWFFA